PPPCCDRCGAPLPRTGRAPEHSCIECAAWPPWLLAARSVALLHPPADRLVHELKYRGWHALAGPLGRLLARLPLPAPLHAALVVPVPTTATRLRQRGYNQAERIAHAFAIATAREARPLLTRTGRAGSQTRLQPASRAANVAGEFRVRSGAEVELAGALVLLVDDVMTTGATALACATALVAAGARGVGVVTFARAFDARRVLAGAHH
ncbi:MAG: ComF family protein, partial [Longimicrobiales bacterium]